MVNYLFFDKSRPDKCCVLPIRVPRSLFNDVSMECRTFFHATLLRKFKFDAEDDGNSIKFWKVSGMMHLMIWPLGMLTRVSPRNPSR